MGWPSGRDIVHYCIGAFLMAGIWYWSDTYASTPSCPVVFSPDDQWLRDRVTRGAGGRQADAASQEGIPDLAADAPGYAYPASNQPRPARRWHWATSPAHN